METNKKLSRKRRNTIVLLILLIPIIAGDIITIQQGKLPLTKMGIPFIMSFVICIFIFFLIRRNDDQKIEGDERSIRIEGRAFTYSWCLSLYTVILLLLNDNLELLKISTSQCLFFILFIMLISNLSIRAILNRKGDIEE